MTLLYIGCDTTIEVAVSDVDRVPAIEAIVTATLYAGALEVVGQDWPLAFTETSAGVYSGVLLASLVLYDGEQLRLEYTATHEGSTAVWEHRFQASIRRATLAT